MTLTQETLKQFLHYDPDSGDFTRVKVSGGKSAVGTKAGTPHIRGYVAIRVVGKKFLAHRLAWLYMYGVWPDKGLDHVNRNKADNRICNLREASQGENMQNKGPYSTKREPQLPVGITKIKNSFVVRVGHNGIKHHIGSFADLDEALKARVNAKKMLHTHHPEQVF